MNTVRQQVRAHTLGATAVFTEDLNGATTVFALEDLDGLVAAETSVQASEHTAPQPSICPVCASPRIDPSLPSHVVDASCFSCGTAPTA